METERNNEQPKWAIYVRGHNLEALTDREARCRRVADQILELTTPPVAVWTDIGTDRLGRDAMLQAASEEGFSTLLTTSPDRISRDLAQYFNVTKTLNTHGVDVIFADLIAEASQQPDGPPHAIHRRVSSSSQQTDMITIRAQERIARQGRMLDRAAPYGITEAEAQVVRWILRMAAQGMSPFKIARTLNRSRVPTQTGAVWNPEAVRQLLKNEWDADIVDRYLFDKMQKWMGRRRDRHILNSALRCETCDFMLYGLLTCGKCGRPMAGATARSGRFYRCIGAYTRTGAPAACDAPSVNADRLERDVWSHVEETIRESAGTTGDSGEEGEFAERCRTIAPRLDGLDQQGKRRVLLDLRVRIKAMFLPDGVWDRAELEFLNAG